MEIIYGGRKFSNDDKSHLFVVDRNGKKIKLKLTGSIPFKSFDVNVGELEPSTDPKGIKITGAQSGNERVIKDSDVIEIINFVDDLSKTNLKLKSWEGSLTFEKQGSVNEDYLYKLIKKILNEQKTERYMFFSNLEQMKRQCENLLSMDENKITQILENGHDWAQDHIAEAKNNMDQVFDFLMNETKKGGMNVEDKDMMNEGRKKAGTKLCARGKAAAKAKFKVYPSAYANGYAVQVCKGRMPGTDGKKKCSQPYC
jgi:hypothetical protein